MADNYTGSEPAVDLQSQDPVEPETVFECRAPKIPEGAVPIFDDDLHAVVGYRLESTAGVYKIYDLEGELIGMEEKGLETPLIDPIDLLFFFGGIFRALGKGAVRAAASAGTKAVATGAARLSARALVATVVGALRAAFKRLSIRSLKFTATTAARMGVKGRQVPLHILHLAIKYGKRVADPQGVKGAFLYTIKMFKNGKEYVLEVVVRESDWTILHFLYK